MCYSLQNVLMYTCICSSVLRCVLLDNIVVRKLETPRACVQVIRMLLAIIGVFFCCWGPKCVLNVLKRYQVNILYTDHAFYVMVGYVK